MSRLVVISNRIADPRKPAAGGLAVALGETLNQTGGLWFGWSGTVTEDGLPGEGTLQTRQAGNVTLATVDLCREDHDSYYYGYSNSVLWPVFPLPAGPGRLQRRLHRRLPAREPDVRPQAAAAAQGRRHHLGA